MQVLLIQETCAVSAGKVNIGIGVAVVVGNKSFSATAATGNAYVSTKAGNGVYMSSSKSGISNQQPSISSTGGISGQKNQHKE